MNIALFSCVMKLNPRNAGRRANLDVGVHSLLHLSHTLGDSALERGDCPHSSTDTREEDISVIQNRNKTKTPTIATTRQCSGEKYYDTRKSNALYEQWYWNKLEKRRQKSRRNQDTGEVSPSILYVILFTNPQDEQKIISWSVQRRTISLIHSGNKRAF